MNAIPDIELMSGADILWLALCIFYEARGESLEGQVAVAHVVVNRAVSRQMAIEDVIKEPHQFSWYNEDTMVSTVFRELGTFFDCVAIVYVCAKERERGENLDGADHFFNPDIVNPSWAERMTFVERIGNHSFYRS